MPGRVHVLVVRQGRSRPELHLYDLFELQGAVLLPLERLTVTTDVEVWREVLAPGSPLVDQSLELRKALISGDNLAASMLIAEYAETMSDEAGRLAHGVCLYLEHMYFLSLRNYDTSTERLVTARNKFEDVNDLRRLGNVLVGIALGSLTVEAFKEARDLTHGVLEPAAARAIMRGIKVRRRKFREWIVFMAGQALQDRYARERGMQSVDAIPRRDG